MLVCFHYSWRSNLRPDPFNARRAVEPVRKLPGLRLFGARRAVVAEVDFLTNSAKTWRKGWPWPPFFTAAQVNRLHIKQVRNSQNLPAMTFCVTSHTERNQIL